MQEDKIYIMKKFFKKSMQLFFYLIYILTSVMLQRRVISGGANRSTNWYMGPWMNREKNHILFENVDEYCEITYQLKFINMHPPIIKRTRQSKFTLFFKILIRKKNLTSSQSILSTKDDRWKGFRVWRCESQTFNCLAIYL